MWTEMFLFKKIWSLKKPLKIKTLNFKKEYLCFNLMLFVFFHTHWKGKVFSNISRKHQNDTGFSSF